MSSCIAFRSFPCASPFDQGEDSHALDDLVLNGGEGYFWEIWTDRP